MKRALIAAGALAALAGAIPTAGPTASSQVVTVAGPSSSTAQQAPASPAKTIAAAEMGIMPGGPSPWRRRDPPKAQSRLSPGTIKKHKLKRAKGRRR